MKTNKHIKTINYHLDNLDISTIKEYLAKRANSQELDALDKLLQKIAIFEMLK